MEHEKKFELSGTRKAQHTANTPQTADQPTTSCGQQQHAWPTEEEIAKRIRIQREIASRSPPKHLMRNVVRKRVGGAISSVVSSCIALIKQPNSPKQNNKERERSGAQSSSSADERKNADGQRDAETSGRAAAQEK